MRLDINLEIVAEEWDARLREFGGTAYHAAAWADYRVAGQPNATPVFYTLISDHEEAVGMALGFRTRSARRWLSGLTGRLEFDAMPAVKDNGLQTCMEFIRLIEDDARHHGDTVLAFGSFASPDRGEILKACHFTPRRRLEFELDITRSEDDLWMSMKSKRRSNIKKACRQGVVVADLPPEEGVAALRHLQAASAKRIVERGGRDITYKGNPRNDPVFTLASGGLGRLVGARVDGEIVSAYLFKCFNGLAYHTLSGHNRTALKTQAPTLLLWETLKRYKAEGMTRLNLGGCSADAVNEDSPEHGVYRYKRDWGGEVLQCTSGRKVLRPVAHGLVQTVRKAFGR